MQASADTAIMVSQSFLGEDVPSAIDRSYNICRIIDRFENEGPSLSLHGNVIRGILKSAMPVQIGAKTHSFSEPTGLLSDCHRLIEMFLRSLQEVAALLDQPLSADARTAMEASLRYFRDAAPKHTADEEESLFPRLRKVNHPDVDAVIKTLDPLEKEHQRADALHREVDRLGTKCLDGSTLSPEDVQRFRQSVTELASIYKEHIRIEDEVVFPVAGRLLAASDKNAIAEEMAQRRNSKS
jgi:hemerythrin-like domain-containing protein